MENNKLNNNPENKKSQLSIAKLRKIFELIQGIEANEVELEECGNWRVRVVKAVPVIAGQPSQLQAINAFPQLEDKKMENNKLNNNPENKKSQLSIAKLRKIFELIQGIEANEVELEECGNWRVRVVKAVPVIAGQPSQLQAINAFPQNDCPKDQADTKKEDEKICIMKSTLIGIFYRASSPKAKPFIEVGDIVKKGQTLCIIGAMKLMNEIEAEVEGKVIEILVKKESDNDCEGDGYVEYGTPLFKIKVF